MNGAVDLSHVRYFIDTSVPAKIQPQLEEILQSYSALPCSGINPNNVQPGAESNTASNSQPATFPEFDINAITHIITNSATYPGHTRVQTYNSRVLDNYKSNPEQQQEPRPSTAPLAAGQRGACIAVVTPRWVTRTLDLRTRQDEQFYSPEPGMIFSGVVACTEDLPPGDSEAIKGVIAAFGGQWRQNLVIEVTHLFCTKPSGRKFDRVMQSGYRLGMKAVLPHWFDDCVKLRYRLQEDDYLFPNPPVLSQTLLQGQQPTYFERLQAYLHLPPFTHLPCQTSRLLESRRASIEDTREYVNALNIRDNDMGSQVMTSTPNGLQGRLRGRRIYIAESCGLTQQRIQTFWDSIRLAGGHLIQAATIRDRLKAIQQAHYVVTRYRAGWEYWKAFDMQKEIGSIDWLVFVLFGAAGQQPAVPAPNGRLLHYPLPQTHVPAFVNTIITVSGYAGPTRDALKRMIEMLGGSFEGNMTKNKTSIVVAATYSGSKVSHAQAWGIPVVNHTWVEDCFASWKYCQVAVPQYTDFTAGQNTFSYNDFVGARGLSPKVILDWSMRPDVMAEKANAFAVLSRLWTDTPDDIDDDMPDGSPLGSAGTLPTLPSNTASTAATPPRPTAYRAADSTVTLTSRAAATPSRPIARTVASTTTLDSRRAGSTIGRDDVSTTAADSPAPAPTPAPPSKPLHTAAAQSRGTPDSSLAQHPSKVSQVMETMDSAMDVDQPTAPQASEDRREEAENVAAALIEKPKPTLKRKAPPSPPAPATPTPTKARTYAPSTVTPLDPKSGPPPTQGIAGKGKRKSELDNLRLDGPNDVSRTWSGRKAAENAAQKLRDVIMPDVNAYAAERNGGGKKRLDQMFGARDDTRHSSGQKPPAQNPGKIRNSHSASTEESDDSDVEASKANTSYSALPKPTQSIRFAETSTSSAAIAPTQKSAKGRAQQLKRDSIPEASKSSQPANKTKSSLPPSKSKVMLTGQTVKIATTGVALEDDIRRALTNKLGARLLDEKLDGVTHIIVKNISRTVKFLAAISYGAYFVTEQWAIDSIRYNQFLDEDKYMLRDREGEEKHSMDLARSLVRARRSKIFDDHTFYITAGVQPPFESLKTIAEAGGAKVLRKLPSAKHMQDRADAHVISSLDERSLWESLSSHHVPIYSGEAIIRAVLRQEMDFEKYTL